MEAVHFHFCFKKKKTGGKRRVNERTAAHRGEKKKKLKKKSHVETFILVQRGKFRLQADTQVCKKKTQLVS